MLRRLGIGEPTDRLSAKLMKTINDGQKPTRLRMILSQFEEAVWHRRGSECDIAEAWHHGDEIVSAVEAVLEFSEVAGCMLWEVRRRVEDLHLT